MNLTKSIRGREFRIEIDPDSGEFSSVVDGEDLRSKTLDALVKTISAKVGTKSLDIPFLKAGDWPQTRELRSGRIISIHSGNGNLIVEFDDAGGRKTQISQAYNRDELFRADMDPLEYRRLDQEREAAADAFRRFCDRNHLDVKAELARRSSGGKHGRRK